MWIRSQNKKGLIKVNRLGINGGCIFNQVLYLEDAGDDYDVLGDYTTEERALEVLNEIEKQINFWKWCKATDFKTAMEFMEDGFEAVSVYEMPQE